MEERTELMKMDILKRFFNLILTALCILFLLTGCAKNEEETGKLYEVYYLAEDENSIMPVEIRMEDGEVRDQVDSLIELLESKPENSACRELLTDNMFFQSVSVTDGQAVVDFGEGINQNPNYLLALMRASLTRTLTQVEGINTVSCTVEGNPMYDSFGEPIGPMSSESFIENAGAQINADEQTMLTLYFASEDGNELVKVTRNVTYSSNISMDKLVMEQLLLGPSENEKGYPVLNDADKIISVTTLDGTCYVNLDQNFLTSGENLSNDVAIYSIVDSLIELGNINKVQFSIDGNSDVMYRETISLSTQFVRNLDIVQK